MNNCKHEWEKMSKKDNTTLNGTKEFRKCKKCGIVGLRPYVQISYIMDIMQKENPSLNVNNTEDFIMMCENGNYLNKIPTAEEVKILIKNKEKFI